MWQVRRALLWCLICGLVLASCGCAVVGTEYEFDMEINLVWYLCLLSGGQPWWHSDSLTQRCRFGPEPRATTAVASAGDVLLLAATAHVSGALGTDWRSDIELHTVSDRTAAMTIRLLRHRTDNSSAPQIDLSVAAGQSLRLADVLANEFDRDGQAALAISVTSGRVIATSRTFNLLSDGNTLGLPGGSTFGQYIPALPVGQSTHTGEEARLIQLSHSSSSDGGFRTNLGIVNTSPFDLDADIELYDAGGALLGIVPVTLGAYGYRQVNQVFASVTSRDVSDGFAVVRSTTPDSTFFAYASVVDNLTGDPIAISAMRVPELEPTVVGEAAWVVAAAHVAGAAGTNWRSDLEVHCWGDTTAAYEIELLEHGEDNSEPETRSYTLAPGASVRFDDVLASEFGFEGQAALRVTPTAGHVLVTSRTYNLLGPGNPTGLPAGATFGQYIPGVSADSAIRLGEEGRLIQLSHTPGGATGFRTNLVLVSTSAAETDVQVDLYRSDGTLLGTVNRTLAPFEYRQMNRIFEQVTGDVVAEGWAVVRPTTSGGAILALASVVDNLTGDPVGIGAIPAHSTGTGAAFGQTEAAFDVLGQTTIGEVVDGIQAVGVDGILDSFVSEQPDVVSAIPGGVLIDYGEGTIMSDGSDWSGSVTVDATGLTTSSNRISGSVTIAVDDLTVNGVAVGSSTTWTVDLEERTDGTVAGEISAQPVGSNAASGTVSGTIGIDTALCEKYPVSGSLTFISGGEIVTIEPSPECNGSLDGEVFTMPPGVDFAYAFSDPGAPGALAFVDSFSNATVSYGYSWWGGDFLDIWREWVPLTGGEDFDATTPGVITFHFAFDRPVTGGSLLLPFVTERRSWGDTGHAFLYGSTDGSNWQLITDTTPAEGSTIQYGGWYWSLPELFIGATDVWLQARLYAYGPYVADGLPYTDVAAMCPYDARKGDNTFELVVDLED